MKIILDFSPVVIFLIMLGVGMSATIKDFIEVFKDKFLVSVEGTRTLTLRSNGF